MVDPELIEKGKQVIIRKAAIGRVRPEEPSLWRGDEEKAKKTLNQ